MKKFLFVACLLAVFCIPALADDGVIGDPANEAGYAITAMSSVDIVHFEPDNTDPLQHKGWAFVYLQNSTAMEWTGFKFGISAPNGGVYFEDDTNIATNVMRGPVFPVEYDYYNGNGDYSVSFADFVDVAGELQPTTLLYTFSRNVLPGEIVKFSAYTDNTTNMNSQFTICMTPLPEPATIAVLGLGALALIRRRK